MTGFPGPVLAVVVCRGGRLPAGADEAAAEAGGSVLLCGDGPDEAAGSGGLPSASTVWWCASPAEPGALSSLLAPALRETELIVMPDSPDGRDLAPRLASAMGRPLIAGAVSVSLISSSPASVAAEVIRVEGRVVVPLRADGPAVATLVPGLRSPAPVGTDAAVEAVVLASGEPGAAGHDAETTALVEPDPATMDLADARQVLAGGAGLVPPGATDEQARATFDLLVAVAGALGASAGATRVVTDAGWMTYDRQIGTTGVSVDPDLYVALGVSGAAQHVGGIGNPAHVASINVDASCPMTSMSDLGLVTDAPGILIELARELGVDVPEPLREGQAV